MKLTRGIRIRETLSSKIKIQSNFIPFGMCFMFSLLSTSIASAYRMDFNVRKISPSQYNSVNRDSTPIVLTTEHVAAVNRKRNLVVQYDAFNELGSDFDKWLEKKFKYVDNPGNQINAIWWDIGGANSAPFPELVGDRYQHPDVKIWWDQGIDWVGRLVEETKSRNLEVFWNFRLAEVEIHKHENPIKTAHPDWLVNSWYYPGLWNYAVPQVRENRLDYLKALLDKYPFDGIQLDFARHVPILPVGAQWENRHHLTEFVRMVRLTLQDYEKKQRRPILLSVKLPRNLTGCRVDGFDVETWSKEKLIDIIVMGSRSMDVDIEAYKEITKGQNIRLIPCWDEHHTTDGYQSPAPEYLRGIFSNWWQQGADGVAVFNWSVDDASEYDIMRYETLGTEMGNPEGLRWKNKVFAVERKGGYPWSEGYFGRNDDAPLPQRLPNDGRPVTLPLRNSDQLSIHTNAIEHVQLEVTIFGAKKGDLIGARVNGVELHKIDENFDCKDTQIFSPKPQPNSGSGLPYGLPIDPEQKLLKLRYAIIPNTTMVGLNQIEMYIQHREPYGHGSDIHNIVLEKIEFSIDYK